MSSKQQKILLLGGSAAQLVAIETAKRLGYYTIVCDYLSDNPGQFVADAFYCVSTTDKDSILDIAKKENIDGIVAYSSDPAAPTAAYVANVLGLPGLEYDKVRCFCEKQLFRNFLCEHGFNVPKSVEITIPYDVADISLMDFQFPVIVKPTDSSGSKGITVLHTEDELVKALQYASEYSRNRVLIVEEYVERDHPHVIEAEIFVVDGMVVSWGLMNSIRDSRSNPLLPAAYSYPLELSAARKSIVKEEVSRLVRTMGHPSGAFNIEMIIDKHDRLFFLDAGPRNGGNMLPEFISMISGKDIVKATILNAMGETDKIDVRLDDEEGGYWGLYVLHTSKDGKFQGITYSDKAQSSLVRASVQKSVGECVRAFQRCNDLVGLSFHHFASKQDMDEVMNQLNDSIKVDLK